MGNTVTLRKSRPTGTRRPRAAVTLALQAHAPLRLSLRMALDPGRGAELGRGKDNQLGAGRFDLDDRAVSERHARLERREADWVLTDLGSKNGVYVNGTRVTEQVIEDGDVFALGSSFLVFRELELDALEDLAAPARAPVGLRTMHPGFGAELARLGRLVRTDTPILVRGATGTGKELLARAIHAESRRSGELIAVNCAAIPETLLASELFGVRKGAFSGAVADRPGLVRAAEKGTLFLDEIAEMSITTQAILLRVLQEREVVPVGETRAIPVDTRFIAATHQDLAARARRDEFREDLLARLGGFTLEIPALRDRAEDLGLILGEICREATASPAFTLDAAWRLFSYAWPQNVRQFGHVIRNAIAFAGDTIALEHLDLPAVSVTEPASRPGKLRATEEALRQALEEHGGNVSAVARQFETSRSQILRLCERYRIPL